MDKYIDQSATYDGDGSSAAQAAGAGQAGAFNTIEGKSFNDGDKVWIRRKEKTYSVDLNLETAGIEYIGWPKSGDDNYTTRPALGQSEGWDADADDYATFKFTVYQYTFNIQTQNDQTFHRIKVWHTYSSSYNLPGALYINGVDPVLKHCFAISEHHYSSKYARAIYLYNSSAKLYNCKGEIESPNTSSAGIYITGSTDYPELYDCEGKNTNGAGKGIYCYYGGLLIRCTGESVSGEGIFISGSYTRHLIDCVAKSTSGYSFNMSGRAYIENLDIPNGKGFYGAYNGGNPPISIKRLNQTYASAAGIDLNYSLTMFVQNATFHNNNSEGDVSVVEGCLVMLRNATFASVTPVYGVRNPGVYSVDDSGVKGIWKHWGPKGMISSNAAYRTGGESFSLKFEITNNDMPSFEPRLSLAQHGMETVWIELAAGEKTITIYGVHKLFGANPPTKDDIYFEFDYLDEASGTHRVLASSRDSAGGAVTSDDSAWNGDADLTKFKLQKTVTVGQTCIVPIRVRYNKYVENAYVYLDPKPAVT